MPSPCKPGPGAAQPKPKVRKIRYRPMNSDQRENRLLKTLDWADFDLLAPHFRQVPLKQGSLLQEQEAPVEQVYFPLSGVISLISVMDGGEVVETAAVGREGAVGVFGDWDPGGHLHVPSFNCRAEIPLSPTLAASS